jgi:hypothetical protein
VDKVPYEGSDLNENKSTEGNTNDRYQSNKQNQNGYAGVIGEAGTAELHYHLPICAVRRQDDYHITTIRKETLILRGTVNFLLKNISGSDGIWRIWANNFLYMKDS